MRTRALWASVTAGLLAAGAGWGIRAAGENDFDHLRHQRLFPTCSGCHRVEATRVTSPEPESCARCHDGETEPRVEWAPSPPRPSNLLFNHADVFHAIRAARDTALACAACHVPEGGRRMDVRRAVVRACLQCHAPESDHLVDAPCEECHVPLTRAVRLSPARIQSFPPPNDHAAPDFVFEHGAAASSNLPRCEICHARQSCSACHVNAPSVPTIQAMAPDPRVAELAAAASPTYPTPPSHTEPRFLETHGGDAEAAPARCEVCHARASCETCHTEPIPDAVRRLPQPPPAEAAIREQAGGVQLTRTAPPSHTPSFLESHRSVAASATAQCRACHTRTECTSCHTGSEALTRPRRRFARYHPENYLQSHPSAAFGATTECAGCHNPAAFCRDCHEELGLTTQGRFDAGFHDAKQNWLFGHGQAARQGLETCTTCHAQQDCLACHSAVSGRRVNPHGPGFDAERLRSKSPALCLTCHFPSILGR